MYVCMYVCVCVYIYIYTYTYINTHTQVHAYTHTYNAFSIQLLGLAILVVLLLHRLGRKGVPLHCRGVGDVEKYRLDAISQKVMCLACVWKHVYLHVRMYVCMCICL